MRCSLKLNTSSKGDMLDSMSAVAIAIILYPPPPIGAIAAVSETRSPHSL